MRISSRLFGVLIALTAATAAIAATARAARAQSGPPGRGVALPADIMDAEKLRQAGKTPQALAAFEALTKKYPKNSFVWLGVGRAAAAANDYPRAVTAFERSVAIDSNPTALYNTGAAHARLGHTDKAFVYLKRAAETGKVPVDVFRGDSDLDKVRDDPRFKELLQIAANPKKS